MTKGLQATLDFAETIAREAGVVLLNGQENVTDGLTTKTSIMDVVTSTDSAAEALVVERIRSEFPDDGIVGEEGASHQGTSGRRWIIDPLDGTINFLHNAEQSAVSIGVEIDGEFAVGVVHNPFRNETFTAANGLGASRNGTQLGQRSESVDVDTAVIGVVGGFDSLPRAERAEIARQLILHVGDVRYSGCASLDFCYVASGRLDASFGNGYSIWDMAAGIVIARETGCLVEGIDNESGPDPVRGVLIAIPSVMPALRLLVQRSLDSGGEGSGRQFADGETSPYEAGTHQGVA